MAKIRDPNAPTASMMTWEGDLPAPITSYESSRYAGGGPASHLDVPHTTTTYRSAVVDRTRRLNGLRMWYAHGATRMPIGSIPRPASNGVQSTAANVSWVNLFDWTQNLGWYPSGYSRMLGFVTRVSQLETNKTGGPSAGTMQQRPLFNRVQRVPRYSVVPQTYATTAGKG